METDGLALKENAMKKMILAAMIVGMAASAALCDDLVDNPAYKAWSGFKVGTVIKTQVTTTMTAADGNEVTSKVTTTSTLKILMADKAVIEAVDEQVIDGKKTAVSRAVEIAAKIAKGPDSKPAGVDVTKKAEGDEDRGVAGKQYKCHWVEERAASDTVENTVKKWTCPDVPGGIVRVESEVTKPHKSKLTIELLEFTAGK
jgi:hypothetical protein